MMCPGWSGPDTRYRKRRGKYRSRCQVCRVFLMRKLLGFGNRWCSRGRKVKTAAARNPNSGLFDDRFVVALGVLNSIAGPQSPRCQMLRGSRLHESSFDLGIVAPRYRH